MGNISFCANDPILRVLAELHILVIREGMPGDRVSEEVKEMQIQTACVKQRHPNTSSRFYKADN